MRGRFRLARAADARIFGIDDDPRSNGEVDSTGIGRKVVWRRCWDSNPDLTLRRGLFYPVELQRRTSERFSDKSQEIA